MSNHAVLDKSLGHLTYAEQRNVVKKLAKLDSNEVLKNKSGECTVSVPDKFKNEVENYVNFLKSKQE